MIFINVKMNKKEFKGVQLSPFKIKVVILKNGYILITKQIQYADELKQINFSFQALNRKLRSENFFQLDNYLTD